jgi:hypothetical protein
MWQKRLIIHANILCTRIYSTTLKGVLPIVEKCCRLGTLK